jgi:hypothetical protein
MTDDLVEQLYNVRCEGLEGLCWEAGDRIKELEAKLAKALRALERIELSTDTREQGAIAMATLAELKGEAKTGG